MVVSKGHQINGVGQSFKMSIVGTRSSQPILEIVGLLRMSFPFDFISIRANRVKTFALGYRALSSCKNYNSASSVSQSVIKLKSS